MPIFKILVLVCLIGIVVSLGSAMYHMMTDKGDSKKMVKALTIRVALSVGLFILLLIAWANGLIQPHAWVGRSSGSHHGHVGDEARETF